MKSKSINVFFALMFLTSIVHSQSISTAKDYYKHNLKEKGLEEFILVYNNPGSSTEDKSEALFFMGQISFDLGQYSVAMDDWEQLINDYPESNYAVEIQAKLIQLNEVFSGSIDENISSSIAKSYMKNGDFYSGSKNVFSIDNSWLPKVELSIDWYDKVIAEFPGSNASEIAYRKKMFAIIGWKEPGQYGQSYGIRKSFKNYMPLLLQTFTEFENAFPNSSYLQGFRYQIAQAYWGKKDWDNTRLWLNKIIENGGEKPTFYTEAAKARLTKVEY
ncbi:tetratricopeptide repeat protein [Marinifilum fragile]|uniref:tetratricopeptide repeat protein n=1 Tax=Marinifilum fragile TaxID=570161 RepID=UPI002AA94CC1|nr:tetratricopeptide repeat protein [Marinifilum fragile]